MTLTDRLIEHLLATAPTRPAERLRGRLWRLLPAADAEPDRGAPVKTHHSDAALYQAFRSGDRHAFDTLLTRHLPKLVGYATRHLHDEGEDAVHTALADFIRKRPPVEGEAVLPVMFGFVRTAVRDVFRKRARRLPDESIPAETDDQLAALARHQADQRLIEALALLDPLQQEVVLRVRNDETNVAIAAALSLTPQNVGVIKHRALQILKRHLERG